MDRNLQIIGLAKKAGLLAVGADDTSCSARAGRARLVVSAADASGNALRRAKSSAEICGAMHIVVPYSSFALGSMSGRGSPGTVAFLDIGLAARFLKGMAEADPERYGEAAGQMAQKTRSHAERNKLIPSGKRRTVK